MPVMMVYVDAMGLPRAWGRAATRKAASAEAHRQLHSYIDKKRALGEEITEQDFTLRNIQEVLNNADE